MIPTVVVINGPNLNRLGKREPEIYGSQTLREVEEMIVARATDIGWRVEAYQSNHEGDLIDRIHRAGDDGAEGIIINPGALSHYSYALADALRSVEVPAVEVHISDISQREEWRHTSVTAAECVRVITGRGVDGYLIALDHLAGLQAELRKAQ